MHILTFDIEEWFHILDNSSTKTAKEWSNYETRIHQNVSRILDFLDHHQAKATFFCLGWIGEQYPEVIREISNRGFEIGSHSHLHQLIFEQEPEEFKRDLDRSIKTLEDITGKKIRSFRAPGFSLTTEVRWAFDELVKHGIEFDSSIFPAQRAHGGMSNFSTLGPHILKYDGVEIKEFPINVKAIAGKRIVYSGGGYFRLFPYPLIKRWSQNSNYVMTYFHPRDFDTNQPKIKELSTFRKFKSYCGLKTSLDKLSSYVKDFDFVDLMTASGQIDWNSADRVELPKHS